jgi:hypothetical protein
MDIKLGQYLLRIEVKKPVKYDRNRSHKAWQKPMTKEDRELFMWADEVLTGAIPDNLCDLCFAPMGDAYVKGRENLCDRCKCTSKMTDWVEP